MELTDKEFRKKLFHASLALTGAQIDWILSGEWRKGADTLYGRNHLRKRRRQTDAHRRKKYTKRI